MPKISSLVGILLMSCVSEAIFAATWYVDCSVSVPGDGTSWESAFKTIQEGIDAASQGETVIVALGTYVENIHFLYKNITLRSVNPLDSNIVASTIIDGSQSGCVVTFSGTENETCTLSGFTIRNGEALAEGGGVCGQAGYLRYTHATIENNVITHNSGGSGGALAYCSGAIQYNIIAGNSAEKYGGGLYNCGGLIKNNAITGNSAGYYGGGLYECNGTIQNNTITGNSAGHDGGGLGWCRGTIQNNTITDNSASVGGALAYCDGTIQNNTITHNSAGWGGDLAHCAGPIENNIMAGNSAGVNGGGLDYCGGMIQNNRITGNSADEDAGGLFVCLGTIRNNSIAGNSARAGGGLYWCDGIIENNTITGNSATLWGGGLYQCSATVTNCIVWGNTARADPQLCESSIPTYSCIEGWIPGGEGNIFMDPRFVNPDGPDNDPNTYEDNEYRLSPPSPCIDTGKNEDWMSQALDHEGNARIVGESVDMGAYEWLSSITGIEFLTTGNLQLTWSSRPEAAYTIWSCCDPSGKSTWTEETTILSGGELTMWADPNPAPVCKFYRIQVW